MCFSGYFSDFWVMERDYSHRKLLTLLSQWPPLTIKKEETDSADLSHHPLGDVSASSACRIERFIGDGAAPQALHWSSRGQCIQRYHEMFL